jgi:hypothetical protein
MINEDLLVLVYVNLFVDGEDVIYDLLYLEYI